MNINNIEAFKDCYILNQTDIERSAETLADGFSQYALFQHICGGEYNHQKMQLFWAVSLALLPENAICIADSKEITSVLVYIRPNSKEAGPFSYIKKGGLKMLFKLGVKSIIRLLRFEAEAQRVAKQYKTSNCGYLMAFATRIDKQGQHYGKPLMEALLNNLDTCGEECYLETLKAKNITLYQHFAFQLKESKNIPLGNLTLYAMHRPAGDVNSKKQE